MEEDVTKKMVDSFGDRDISIGEVEHVEQEDDGEPEALDDVHGGPLPPALVSQDHRNSCESLVCCSPC